MRMRMKMRIEDNLERDRRPLHLQINRLYRGMHVIARQQRKAAPLPRQDVSPSHHPRMMRDVRSPPDPQGGWTGSTGSSER